MSSNIPTPFIIRADWFSRNAASVQGNLKEKTHDQLANVRMV
jgi:hypothetical protein